MNHLYTCTPVHLYTPVGLLAAVRSDVIVIMTRGREALAADVTGVWLLAYNKSMVWFELKINIVFYAHKVVSYIC